MNSKDGSVESPDGASGEPRPSVRWAWRIGVAALLLISAVILYQHFWQNAESLWYSVGHDRNGHYRRSQAVALALRDADLGGLIKEIHAATVWPPLHPLVTGSVLSVAGIDYRLAVLPSLAAWVATCWFACALAVRLAPGHKGLAGGVALLFTLASPAHRAFAADIMVESLGAALTLAALYFYVTARQERSVWRGRCSGLLMLALFLTKYNYWTLLIAGLALAALWEFRRPLAEAVRVRWRQGNWSRWWVEQLRHPLTYLLIPAIGLALYVKYVGGVLFFLAGWRVSITTLNFPALVCYVLLLLRILPWWRRTGRQAVAGLPVPAQQLVRWHAYPLAVWFLWPHRLGVFLWYLTYSQHGRVGDTSPWLGNLHYYWQCLTHDYHAGLSSLVVVLALVALAVVLRRRGEGASFAVFVVLAGAALLTNYHSANRSRFLHSWMPVGWVVAGVGAAAVVERLGRSWRGVVRPALPVVALAGLACLQLPALTQSGHADEGGPNDRYPSLLGLADVVGAEVVDAHRPVLLSNSPFELLFDWRLGECWGFGRRRLLVPPRDLVLMAPEEGELGAWLRRNACDVVLLIDAPPNRGSPFDPRFDAGRLRTALVSSGDFVLAAEWRLRTADGIVLQVWRPIGNRYLHGASR